MRGLAGEEGKGLREARMSRKQNGHKGTDM